MLVINPGSGIVENTSRKHADANIKQFIKDVGLDIKCKFLRLDEDGRHVYRLKHKGRKHIISMVGMPLDRVRWMDNEGQRISHFPRLYIDYSSFVWKYAVELCFTDNN